MRKTVLKKITRALSATLLAGAVLATTACAATGKSESKSVSSAKNNADAKTIKVGISTYPSPNYRINEKGEEEGYELEVLKAIDEELPQYKIEIVPLEFSGLFVALNSGQVQVLSANLRRSDAREEEYIHTYRAYNHSPYRIFVEDSNTDINGLADLDGKKVGIAQGSLMEAILKEYIENTGAKIEFVYSNDAASDLAAGRIDAFINPEFTLEDYNKNFSEIQFKLVGDVVAGEEGVTADSNAYFYLTKGNEQIRDDFSEALHTLKENGTLSELSKQFFPKDTASEIEVDKEEEQIKALGK